MRAMILAAGRGERMRPLTDHIPKPLLEVGGIPLIEHHIARLRAAGINRLVINYAHLGEQIVAHLGDGRDLGVEIRYSPEPAGALETGGGIRHALPLLGEEPFLVINGDVWSDYPYIDMQLDTDKCAHLVLVDNPEHNPQGDFGLIDNRVQENTQHNLTFSGIGVYHPRLFDATPDGIFPLAPLLRAAMQRGEVSGEYYAGRWIDIGTPQRLEALNQEFKKG